MRINTYTAACGEPEAFVWNVVVYVRAVCGVRRVRVYCVSGDRMEQQAAVMAAEAQLSGKIIYLTIHDYTIIYYNYTHVVLCRPAPFVICKQLAENDVLIELAST